MATINEITITDWKKFREIVSSTKFKSWAFRGQSDASWPIKSSITRTLEDFNIDKRSWSFQEQRILRIFKRKAHLYLTHIPEEKDNFQWLSLMQHFGAPTRLVDFSWSPYVAAFFALERATKDSAVWAIFPAKIDHSDKQTIRNNEIINPREYWMRIKDNYQKYFLNNSKPFVITGEPEILNQRIIAQSGTFAVPGVIDEPLENLLLDYNDSDNVITKFILKKEIRDEAMWDLYNNNITNATLFPDINGMAKSLHYELEFHWAFDVKKYKLNNGFDNSPFDLPSGL